jgi:hypothetical protein
MRSMRGYAHGIATDSDDSMASEGSYNNIRVSRTKQIAKVRELRRRYRRELVLAALPS